MPDGETGTDPVDRAMAREAVLRAEIEQRIEELKEIEIFLTLHRKFSGMPSQINQSSEKDGVKLRKATRRSPRGMNRADFILFVRTLILERGRPMDKEEICDGFRRKGRRIGGKPGFESKNMDKRLGRVGKDIKHISGAGYWPIDVPCQGCSTLLGLPY